MKIKPAYTLKGYKKENLIKDIFTGIIIMAVFIPISMGYAQIAACRQYMVYMARFSQL